MSEKTVRNEKDVVFKIVFEDKDNLLSLYNALAGTNYEDASLIEINTLQDVVYIGMKNALSFILDGRMTLFEHQSTVNANMPLLDYATFHQRIRENVETGMAKEEAVNTAVDSCIRDGILADILKKERAKIMASILAEFDAEEYAEMLKRESREEGKIEGKIELICKKLRKNKTPAQIADELEEELAVIQEVCEVAKSYAPEYDDEKIYQELKNRQNK